MSDKRCTTAAAAAAAAEIDNADGDCVDQCLRRYEQLLYAMCCLGLLTCYYAFTIGFLGCGPVTFVYR
jgi:hypothetical protein